MDIFATLITNVITALPASIAAFRPEQQNGANTDMVANLITHAVAVLPASVVAICAFALMARVVSFVVSENL